MANMGVPGQYAGQATGPAVAAPTSAAPPVGAMVLPQVPAAVASQITETPKVCLMYSHN